MAGIFTATARVLSARDQAKREAEEAQRRRQIEEEERARQEADRAAAEQERQIRMAATLAALGGTGIVKNDAREQIAVGGQSEPRTMGTGAAVAKTAMPLPATPNLVTGQGTVAAPTTSIETNIRATRPDALPTIAPEKVVDPRRYEELGKTGYSLDTENTAAKVAERRAKAVQEQKIRQRIAALRARQPERYGPMTDEELAGIAADDEAYREGLKDVKKEAPRTLNTSAGIKEWDPTTGTWRSTGYQAPPRATGAGSGSPTTAQQRDALQDRIGIITQQITQAEKAIGDFPFIPQRDTSQSAVQSRAAKQRLQAQLEQLRKDQAELTAQLDQFSPPAPNRPAEPPEGLDLSAAAAATAVEREKADVAIARIQKGEGGATLEKAMASPYLSSAMKALIWQRINGRR